MPATDRQVVAIVVLLALLFLANVTTGREERVAPPSTPETNVRAPQPSIAPARVDLDLDRLRRVRRPREVPDLFGTDRKIPEVPVAMAARAPAEPAIASPPKSTAPALPFVYAGYMVKGERTIAYLLKGQDLLLAEVGQTLADGAYRVEEITPSEVRFVYVPLGARQSVTVASR